MKQYQKIQAGILKPLNVEAHIPVEAYRFIHKQSLTNNRPIRRIVEDLIIEYYQQYGKA